MPDQNRQLRICSQAIAAACALALAMPTSAVAHATLVRSIPAQGTIVRAAPELVMMTFDEAVEGNFGSVRVFGPNGQRLDAGKAFHPGGRADRLAVKVDPTAPVGTSTVTWRAVSADGHVVGGGYTFSIKRQSEPNQSVAQLSQPTAAPLSTRLLMGAARTGQFAAIAVALGAILFLLLVWERLPEEGRRLRGGYDSRIRRRLSVALAAASAVGLSASIVGVVAQGEIAEGFSAFDGLTWSAVSDTLGTRFGMVWGIAAIAWAAVAAGTFLIRRPGRIAAVLAIPLGFLTAVPALSGHAAARDNPGLEAALNVTHVVAMSAWVGGVAALLVVVFPVVAGRDGSSRLLAAVFERFSSVAIWAVALVVVTGVAQTALTLQSLSQIYSSSYGRALLIKIVGLLALITAGGLHRRRVIPKLKPPAGFGGASAGLARRVLLAETALFALIMIATAALASFSPAAQAQIGPVSESFEAGPVLVQMTVDPARVGGNTIHLLLSDPKTGASYTKAIEVRASETLPAKSLGPLTQRAHRAGPGHWIVAGAPVPAAGAWKLEVTVRVSAFDEYSGRATVPVR